MTDRHDPDAIMIRDVFRRHETLIDDDIERLMPAMVKRRQRRQITQRSSFVVVILVVAGLLVAASGVVGRLAADHRPAPSGYKWEHALGVEIAVPVDWPVQHADPETVGSCGWGGVVLPGPPSPRGPNIGYPQGSFCEFQLSGPDVAFIMPATVQIKDVFSITPFGVTPRSTTIDGVPAVRESGRIGLGGPSTFEGYVTITSRGVTVIVRSSDGAVLTTILDSVHLS